MQVLAILPGTTALERVEASDDPSVVHLAALGWVSELALLVGA